MTTSAYPCFFNYFGLRENPFHASPDPRFYHSTPAHDSAIHELLFGLNTKQGLLVLTGEAGTGKTTVLNSVLDTLARRHTSSAYVFHPLLEPVELFEFILRDFGIVPASNRKGDLLRALHAWLIARNAAGDFPVLVLDEAQSLSLETLDELRLLLNLETPRGKLLQIILAGQSELDEKFRRTELRQLRQRIMFQCKLPVFAEQETASYIHFRVSRAGSVAADLFPPESVQAIHEYSKGIPRLINLLCEHALITAYGEQQQAVSAESIQRIAADFDLAAKPISVADENSADGSRRFISFPLFEPEPSSTSRNADVEPGIRAEGPSLVPAVAEGGVAENDASAPAPLSQQELGFLWAERHPPALLPQFLRRALITFSAYWRGVGRSFVSDCRYFFRHSLQPLWDGRFRVTRKTKGRSIAT
jgi:general secretion pathway protein A